VILFAFLCEDWRALSAKGDAPLRDDVQVLTNAFTVEANFEYAT